MNNGVAARRGGEWALAGLFGLWAAAIALAPAVESKAVLAAPAILIPGAWWTISRAGRWIPAFLATSLLLPPLPVALGDSGPHISILFAALGVAAGILRLGEWRLPATSLHAAMTALWGVLLASVAAAAFFSGPEHAAASFARVALFGIPVYVFFYASCGPGRFENLRPVYWVAVLAALLACVDFYFQLPAPAGYGPQFVWLDSGAIYRRAQGMFYEASTLGNFCAFFLVMIAVAFSLPKTERPLSSKALGFGAAVFSAALVLSYSRASVLNVIVAVAVLWWLNRRRVPLGKIALGAVAGTLVVWKLFPALAEQYWDRLSGSVQFFSSAGAGVLSGRAQSWETLLNWILAHPWQTLLGIGYKTLPYTQYLGAPVVADNMYLSLLVETGVAGLAALVWLNVAILRAARGATRASDPRRRFFGAWMLCFWSGQVVQMASGDLLTYWRVLPLYFWALAVAVRE